MEVRTAVVASLCLHACIAWLAMRSAGVPRISRPSTTAAPADPQPATPLARLEPLDVVLIDSGPQAARAAPAPPSPPPRAVATSAPAAAASPSSTVAAAAIESTAAGARGDDAGATAGPVRSRSLAMRGPDLRLPEPFLDRMARGGRVPEAVSRSGRVEPAGGGTAVIEDRVTTVHIARDGTVRFEDKPDFEIHFELPIPTPSRIKRYAAAAGRQLSAWYADPYAQTRAGTMQDVPGHLAMHPGDCDHWDDPCSRAMRAIQRKPDASSIPPLIWGKFEFSDALIRLFAGDPYASRKRKLLDDTRAERAELSAQHRAEDLARSAELALRNLEALWRATEDPAARRDALFALWDECAEGDDPDGEAGQRARLMVIGWIRAKLPPGSPGAFDPDEIAARSAHRRSRQPFVPYE